MTAFKFKNFVTLLSIQEKKTLIILICLLVFSVLLEAMGIGLILPLISILIEPETIINYFSQFNFVPDFVLKSNETFLQTVVIFIILVFTLKAIILTIFTKVYINFGYSLQFSLSKKLYWKYLKSTYDFHVNKNTSTLIRNLNIEITNLIKGYFFAVIQLATEIFVIFAILIVLLYLKFNLTIIIIIYFSLIVIPYLIFIRKKNKEWGDNRQFYENQQIKDLQSSFGGIRDVIINNAYDYFAKSFYNCTYQKIKNNENQDFAISMPRLWIEQLSVLCICTYIFFYSLTNGTVSSVIPSIGIITASAFRILPSLNRVINSYQNFRFYSSVIDTIHYELTDYTYSEIDKLDLDKNINLKFDKAINFNNVSYHYRNSENLVLDNINFTINKGDKIGISGESGSGKSTLLDLFMGLILPIKGKILIDNKDLLNFQTNWRSIIGYVPQSVFLTDSSIAENVAFGVDKELIDREKVTNILFDMGLENFIKNLPQKIDTIVGERGTKLSGGQKQRLGIARALYRSPEILVLDEATSALDENTEKLITDCLNEKFKDLTIIIVAHRINAFKFCKKLKKIENYKLILK